jgi:hypothetical protein
VALALDASSSEEIRMLSFAMLAVLFRIIFLITRIVAKERAVNKRERDSDEPPAM